MRAPRRLLCWTLALATWAAPDLAAAEGEEAKSDLGSSFELANGDAISWGLVLSAVRFRVSRREDQPGRVRDYQPDIDVFSGQFGFQVIWNPDDPPFTVELEDGGSLQVFSIGFQLLGAIDTERFEQSELAITLSIGLLNNVLGLGFGFDLYRGIPILDRNGLPGGDTAFTGLLPWAWATEGEMTPENFVATIYLNLTGLVSAVQGAGG
ncbi:MAG TPA: hypothetical protein RMH99_16625 [Sandaracinaceae bacterium LLY-WYZ-13_1]|nr:hypothetical protein [Sandaracinaceae bacterium LLY-WYZ-13_1]